MPVHYLCLTELCSLRGPDSSSVPGLQKGSFHLATQRGPPVTRLPEREARCHRNRIQWRKLDIYSQKFVFVLFCILVSSGDFIAVSLSACCFV